jgi:hypothetical protein
MKTVNQLKKLFPEFTWIGLTDGKAIQKEVEKYIETHQDWIEANNRALGYKAYYRYPAYKSERFFKCLYLLDCASLDEFRVRDEYINAVKDGLIKDDEWNVDGEIMSEEKMKELYGF